MDKKQRASIFAIISVLILALVKFFSGWYTNSIAILSSALDNLQDIFISTLNFFAIRKACMPPDKNHRYGHGKVEDLSAFFESLIILMTGIYVIYKAIIRFYNDEPLRSPELAIFVMIISFFWSLIVAHYLKKVGEKTNSPALKADSLHYLSDVYSNGGVILSIIFSFYFGYKILDPITGIVIGLIIIFSSFSIFKDGILALTDTKVTDEIHEKIEKIISTMPYPYAGYHKLRTRTSGSRKYIDFHLLVCRKSSLENAHSLSEKIEKEIDLELSNTDVTTHLEPCPFICDLTEETCRAKKMGIVKW